MSSQKTWIASVYVTTVRLNSADPVSFDTDALIVGFTAGQDGPTPAGVESLDAAFGGKLAASLGAVAFSGKSGELAKLPTFGAVTAPPSSRPHGTALASRASSAVMIHER